MLQRCFTFWCLFASKDAAAAAAIWLQERAAEQQQRHPSGHWPETSYVLADEEYLPLAEGSVDRE
jgi:hypothetical protein